MLATLSERRNVKVIVKLTPEQIEFAEKNKPFIEQYVAAAIESVLQKWADEDTEKYLKGSNKSEAD